MIEKTTKQDLHQGSGKILVTDDEPHIREVLTTMIERMGYGVATAKSVEEALEIPTSLSLTGWTI
ncbi:MAG: hypothetical protein Q8K00_01085 [Syntrophales bacterium]|nr:hypothetical protein [Syntrophales bacterium]